MSKKIKAGIVGVGKIAQTLYLPNLINHPDVKLKAICDIDDVNIDLVTKLYKISKVYRDYKEMIDKEDLDAVFVCTPNYLHAPITIYAASKGLHVMVEKPMAITMKEAKEMVKTAKKNKVILMVDQSQRFVPLHQKAKEIMDSGILGKVLSVRTTFGHAGPENWSPRGKWFFEKEKAGFGPLADLGVHKVDLVRYLTGLEVTEVAAFTSRLEKDWATVEDNAAIILKFNNEALGVVTANWITHGDESNDVILYCENGVLKINVEKNRRLFVELVKPVVSTLEIEVPPMVTNAQGGWKIPSIDNFIDAILGRAECLVPGEEGMKSLEIILAANISAETGKIVKLPLNE